MACNPVRIASPHAPVTSNQSAGVRFRFLSTLALIAVGIGSIIASGGGGGGGSSEPPPPGPGDVENFFPDAVGNAWFYDGTYADGSAPVPVVYFNDITVTDSRLVGGVTARVFFETNAENFNEPVEGYFNKDADGVTNLGTNEAADYISRSVAPYREALFPVAAGLVLDESRSGVSAGEDLDGDGRNELVDFDYEIRILGFEGTSTSAGTFPRTAKRRVRLTGTLRTTSSGNFPFESEELSWWAPGTGLVRRQVTFDLDGVTADDVIELRGSLVDGVGQGLSLPVTLAGNLAPGDSNAEQPGRAGVASDGTRFLTVTERKTNSDPASTLGRIIGVFSDQTGATTGTFNVTEERAGPPSGRVALAFNGSNFLAVLPGTPLRSQRITPAGVALDGPQGLPLAPDGSAFGDVASNGNEFLAVYTRFDNINNRHLLYGVRIGANGQITAPGEFPLAIGPGLNKGTPAVAFDGTNYLVTWLDVDGACCGQGSIYGTRVSPGGSVLDPGGILIADSADYFAVASSSQNSLVTWVQAGSVRGMRVAPDGTLLDGTAQSGGFLIDGAAAYQKRHLAASYDGSEYLVAWAAGAYASNPGPPVGIFAARVSPAGSVLNGSAISVSGPPVDFEQFHYPAIASGGGASLVNWLALGEVKSQVGVTVWSFAE